MAKLLITGGAGFIGSNFIKYILDKYDNYKIINLDALTYAGNLENLEEIESNSNYEFIKGSITDRKLIENIMLDGINYVINFAAESHVDRSIEDPELFIKTNVLGTQVLLDVAKKVWQIGTDKTGSPLYMNNVKYIQISTDEVYGALGREGKFTEKTQLSPNSPYSASKASADMIVKSYYETFRLPINITRCSNNYGPYQFPEKLIPLMIVNCINDKELPVYGDGLQIRDWLHVKDHCSAIDIVMHKGINGEIYNIGGNNEKANIEIVKLIIELLGKSNKQIKYVKDRLGHDRRYAIDNTKITSELGWSPSYEFLEGISETVKWYVNNRAWWENIVNGDYKSYYRKMYGKKQIEEIK